MPGVTVLDPASPYAPSADEIAHYHEHGWLRIDGAFPRALADAGRAIVARDLPCDAGDPATWTEPVVRLGFYPGPPFREAANTPRLHAAFDALAGEGRWAPLGGLGTWPVRFPVDREPGDTGWHVDVSFGFEASDFMDWRANAASKGRALLMLFLFSDVGEADAPTRILSGSHLEMARLLAPHGDAGLTLREMAAAGFGLTGGETEVLATGPAGTVYLCHPFLVHAAQAHRGTAPKFMAQPPLLWRG